MSFPDKKQRKICWDSRDRYWECLDEQNIKDSSETPKVCAALRRVFENSCPSKWVTHFDRKRDYNVFKEKMKQKYKAAMQSLDNIYVQLKKPTNNIKPELLQELVIAVKKSKYSEGEIINDILKVLWKHMSNGFTHFDEQLLCSTTFFSVLCKADVNNFYLSKVETIVNNQLQTERKERKPFHAISLIYGMFQSSYFLNQTLLIHNFETLKTFLQAAFDLLVHIAYEYSQYTFISFKIISSFKKIIGTSVQNMIFHKENQLKLLSLVNNNWENPITGVRNMNRTIFKNVLSVLDEQMYKVILNDINQMYWNKAKYLMLTEIVENFEANIESFVREHHWVDGLLSSLYKPGLVSAGSDMYFAILKKLKNENDWKSLFLTGIINILTSQQQKAIENFSNYWCLVTFKKNPTLLLSLINGLKQTEDSDTVSYSYLCLLKHGCKLGTVKKNWSLPTEDSEVDMILESLKHYKPCIRMIAFEILCATEKSMPTQLQYDNVLQFLWENVNSDCTVLRLSMLNNLATFLSKLNSLFSYYYKGDNKDAKLSSLQSFCRDLQNLIIKSFNYEGNYQRKFTTVHLTQIILKNFKDIHYKNKDTKKSSLSLMNFLKINGYWYLHEKDFLMKLIYLLKDPANDIHENVSKILLIYYIEDICDDTSILDNLIDDALVCINSKFFYEIGCGQLIFKLIANILLNGNLGAKFKRVEDIFQFAYNVLREEYNTQNIVESIENGKQLHSYINIIYVTLQACIQQSYKIQIPNETVQTLVTMLEFISNQFAWEKESKSSDFSRMYDMVQNLITGAGYDYKNLEDETKISGQYQLVLNCLWLNVKACCDLSSLLIQYNIDVIACEKCLNTITNVLETSRHKGAIEAGGIAIGNAIRYLTGLPENNNLSKLPLSLLEKKLDELISEASKTSSVTRRGAGLSIMVHRIVSSDISKGKPLFHYFMKVLLSTCNSNNALRNNVQNVNKDDLPKAVYIHSLTRIVMDSSLASDMMFYATELGELAFQNLADEHWQIRNAALQLYGALIPKLIGQKKSCGTDEESVISVACDEFKTHFPTLWVYILQRIEDQDCSDKLQAHSNLVPILNILANMGKRYTFSCDLNQFDLNTLSVNLLQLLGSPIYVVRRLTSKAIANIFTLEIFEQVLKTNCHLTENFHHGLLLLITNFKKYNCEINNKVMLKRLLKPSNQSFLCKLYYDDLFSDNNYDSVKSVLKEVHINRYAPGIYLCVNNSIKKCIQNTAWNNIPQLLKLLVHYNEFENCCRSLHKKMETDNNIPKETIIDLTNLLLSTKQCNSSIIWELLYNISLKCRLHENVDYMMIMAQLHTDNLYRIRYIVPLAARICTQNADNHNLLHISNIIFNLSNPDLSDVDMRYISAKANNEIAHEFFKLSDDIKIVSIKTAIILLQDEDEDIRHLSSCFYSNVMNDKKVLNPFVCINRIMNLKFIKLSLEKPDSGVKSICDDIWKLINPIAIHESNNKFNPFGSDSKNIYMENNVLKELIENLTCIN